MNEDRSFQKLPPILLLYGIIIKMKSIILCNISNNFFFKIKINRNLKYSRSNIESIGGNNNNNNNRILSGIN